MENIGDWFDNEIASQVDWDGDLETDLVKKVDAAEDYILKRLLELHGLPFDSRRGTYTIQELGASISDGAQQEIWTDTKCLFLRSQ